MEQQLFGGESIAPEVIETAETDVKNLLAAVAVAAGCTIKMAGVDGSSTHVLCKLLELKWHGDLVQKFQHFCALHCLPLVGGIVSLVGGVILVIKGAYDVYSIVNNQPMFRRVKERINRDIGPVLNRMHILLTMLLAEGDDIRSQKMQFVLYQVCQNYEALMFDIEKELAAIRKGLSNSKWGVAATVLGMLSGIASIAASLFFFLGPFSIVPAILYATGGGLTLCGSFLTACSQISKKTMKNTIDEAMKNVKPTLFRNLRDILYRGKGSLHFDQYLIQVRELAQKFGTELKEDLLSEIIEADIKAVDRTRYCKDCPDQSPPRLIFYGHNFPSVPLKCSYCNKLYARTGDMELQKERSLRNLSLTLAPTPNSLY